MPNRTDLTYVEGIKNPIKVRPPCGDRILIILHTVRSGERIPFTIFDDLLLDLRHSPVIKSIVGELSKSCTTGLTYVLSCVIASRTG